MSKKNKQQGVTAEQIVEAAQIIAAAATPPAPVNAAPAPVPEILEADTAPIAIAVLDQIISTLNGIMPGVTMLSVKAHPGSIDGKFFDAFLSLDLTPDAYDDLLRAVKDAQPVSGQPGTIELHGVLRKGNDKIFRFIFRLNTPDEISGRTEGGECPTVMEDKTWQEQS